MEKDGFKCTSIQGDMDPGARDRVINEFRDGKTRVLIATDVLSRGFDVQQVQHLQHQMVNEQTLRLQDPYIPAILASGICGLSMSCRSIVNLVQSLSSSADSRI